MTTARVDSYLYIQSTRVGVLTAESQTEGHRDEIAISTWQWGATASAAPGSAQGASRRTYRPLVVQKRLDASTTKLLSALTKDDLLEVRLTLTENASGMVDYFQIVLTDARLIDIGIDQRDDGLVYEQLSFNYARVQVQFKANHLESGSGRRGAVADFADDVAAR